MIHAKEFSRIKKRLNEILLKHTGQTLDKIEKDTDRDRFMSAEEAAEYHLIDNVIDRMVVVPQATRAPNSEGCRAVNGPPVFTAGRNAHNRVSPEVSMFRSFLAVSAALLLASSCVAQDGRHFATGIKIGEVTSDSAIIWARLTARERPVPDDGSQPLPKEAPDTAVDTLPGAVPGAVGDVQLLVSTKSRFFPGQRAAGRSVTAGHRFQSPVANQKSGAGDKVFRARAGVRCHRPAAEPVRRQLHDRPQAGPVAGRAIRRRGLPGLSRPRRSGWFSHLWGDGQGPARFCRDHRR